ncbi:MAG: AAA family ATPase [Actinomycetota bacterium]|nr:AAA family ATPase [Actinomycetota bacterium]
MADAIDDPWASVTTVGGLPADEVISTLQKSIRRGDVRNAVLCAAEMSSTSEDLDRLLWDRLHVIAVEDIGFGLPWAIATIVALDTARCRYEPGSHDRLLFAAHAVRLLAGSDKDRSNDELVSVLRLDIAAGAVPEIPDHALDMHTGRGREMDRGLVHFLTEGALVVPEHAGRDRQWRTQLLERLGMDPDPA